MSDEWKNMSISIDRLLGILGKRLEVEWAESERLRAHEPQPKAHVAYECVSLSRMRQAILRDDLSETEKDHIYKEGCEQCGKAMKLIQTQVWHPGAVDLLWYDLGKLSEDGFEDTWYHLHDEQCKRCLLIVKGLRCNPRFRREARELAAALDISDPLERDQRLRALAPHLSEPLQAEALREVLTTTRNIHDQSPDLLGSSEPDSAMPKLGGTDYLMLPSEDDESARAGSQFFAADQIMKGPEASLLGDQFATDKPETRFELGEHLRGVLYYDRVVYIIEIESEEYPVGTLVELMIHGEQDQLTWHRFIMLGEGYKKKHQIGRAAVRVDLPAEFVPIGRIVMDPRSLREEDANDLMASYRAAEDDDKNVLPVWREWATRSLQAEELADKVRETLKQIGVSNEG